MSQGADGRTFGQKRFRQRFAGKSLNLRMQVHREKGIPALFEKIIINGKGFNFNRLPPDFAVAPSASGRPTTAFS